MKLSRTDVKTPCLVHGHSPVAHVEHTDDFGFGHRIEVCERCLDAAVEQYQEVRACKDCGEPIGRADGLEQYGKLTPLCTGCQCKRIVRAMED